MAFKGLGKMRAVGKIQINRDFRYRLVAKGQQPLCLQNASRCYDIGGGTICYFLANYVEMVLCDMQLPGIKRSGLVLLEMLLEALFEQFELQEVFARNRSFQPVIGESLDLREKDVQIRLDDQRVPILSPLLEFHLPNGQQQFIKPAFL